MADDTPAKAREMRKAFFVLLKGVHDREQAALEQSRKDATRGFQAQLAGHLPKMPTQRLERVLSQPTAEDSLLDGRDFLYLEPLSKGPPALPVVALDYDFQAPSPSLSIRVMLFRPDESEREVDTFGFRLETGDQQGTMHRYHHAQMIRHLEGKGRSLAIAGWKIRSSWVPETQPALPLDSHSPLSLLLCLLISLYGPKYLIELKHTVTNQRVWGVVESHLDDMHLETRR